MKHAKWWAASVGTATGDVLTTWIALTQLTGLREANQNIVALSGEIGLLPALIALKAVFIVVMVALYWIMGKIDERVQWTVPAVAAAFYAVVVVWNLSRMLLVV